MCDVSLTIIKHHKPPRGFFSFHSIRLNPAKSSLTSGLVEYPPVTTTCSSNLRIADRAAEFAKRHGLEDVLPLVIDLTERLFPMAQAVDVELVADDEQPDQQAIFFKVLGLDIEPRLGSDLHWQWASELQQICSGSGRAFVGLELCWVD